MGCGSEGGDWYRGALHLKYRGVLPRYHHGGPVRRPENRPVGEAVVDSKGPAEDENIPQLRGEAAMWPPQ